MRDFSDFEREIIERILELEEKNSLNVLGNILSNKFDYYGSYYIKIVSDSECYLKISKSFFNTIEKSGDINILKNIIQKTNKFIFITLKLIEYLEINGLLFSSGDDDMPSIFPEIVDEDYVIGPSIDKEISKLLYKYNKKKFIPTETLYRLKENNYFSDEEMRHREIVNQYNKTLKRSTWGIIISLIAVIVTITIALCIPVNTNTNLKYSSQPLAIDINPKLLSDISQKLEEINNSIKTQEFQKKGGLSETSHPGAHK